MLRIRRLHGLMFLAVLVLPMSLPAQEDGDRIAGGTVRTIQSSILEEERTLIVDLPDDYASTNTEYPVFYMLDGGERSFAKASSELKALQDTGQVPRMILVAITNTDRNRDMIPVRVPGRPTSGGSAEFLRFVREEMLPFVEQNYRVSDFSVLMGTSNTALFAVYTLLHQPSTFDAYLASSPMIGHCPELIQSAADKLLKSNPTIENSLYIIYGDRDSPSVTERVPDLMKQFESNMPRGFRVEDVVLRGQSHVPASSLTRGLKWIFRDNGEVAQ